jgi:hypothetical protein
LLTDDPGTPERGKWEINLAFTYDQMEHEHVLQTPLVDMNYGVMDHLQFKLELPYETTTAGPTTPRSYGLGDSLIGLKWRFLDEDKNKVSMSFYPQFEFQSVALQYTRSREPVQVHALLPVQVEKKLGPVTFGYEYGVDLENRSKPQCFSGLTAGHEFIERFELLGEVRETSELSLKRQNWVANGGFRIKVNTLLSLLGSAGTAVKRADKDQAKIFSYFALQFTF